MGAAVVGLCVLGTLEAWTVRELLREWRRAR